MKPHEIEHGWNLKTRSYVSHDIAFVYLDQGSIHLGNFGIGSSFPAGASAGSRSRRTSSRLGAAWAATCPPAASVHVAPSVASKAKRLAATACGRNVRVCRVLPTWLKYLDRKAETWHIYVRAGVRIGGLGGHRGRRLRNRRRRRRAETLQRRGAPQRHLRVRSHCRIRYRSTECVSESGMKWTSVASTKRQ